MTKKTSAAQPTKSKKKYIAVLLACFFSIGGWIYIYRHSSDKFWGVQIAWLILLITMSWRMILVWNMVINAWVLIDIARRPSSFYKNYFTIKPPAQYTSGQSSRS